MGRQNPGDTSEPFNMAYLALRGSGQVNGVSKLHGQVSRQIFQPALSAMAAGRSSDRLSDQWNSCADLGFSSGRCALDLSLRQKRWRGDRPAEDDIRQLTERATVAIAHNWAKDDDRADARTLRVQLAAKAGSPRMRAASLTRMC
jgi:hypothetical protein